MSLVTLDAKTPVAQILSVLDRDGCVILGNLVPIRSVARLRADLAPLFHATATGQDDFSGQRTRRVAGLVRKLPFIHPILTDPSLLAVMSGIFEKHCDSFQLNVTQAIDLGPDETAQPLHRDDDLYPFDHPGYQVITNSILALTRFTRANGATLVVPGSHRWPKTRAAREDEIFAAEMEPGSIVLYLGSTLHGGGANITEQSRSGIVIGYALGWVRQMENQYLGVPMAEARKLPEDLQRLIGYQAHRPNLGWHECRDPMDFLRTEKPDSAAASMFEPGHYAKLERNIVTSY